MQWQKISNVPPPIGPILMIHDTKYDSVHFAKLDDIGRIEVRDTYLDGKFGGFFLRMNFQEYVKNYGDHIYWCLYKKPFE